MITEDLIITTRKVLVLQAQDDVVGLWTILWDIEQKVPEIPPVDLMRAVLAVIDSAI